MPISDTYERRSVESLWVDRTKRQRRTLFTEGGVFINDDGIVESIKLHGVLSPVLCTRAGELIFGERRWTASKLCGLRDVPVRYVEDLPALELRALELEENIRRSELSWQDQVKAIADLHGTYSLQRQEAITAAIASGTPDLATAQLKPWTMTDTAESLQIAKADISRYLRVAEAWTHPIDAGRIEGAQNVRQAYNTLTRMDDRRSAEVMEDIISGAGDVVAGTLGGVQSPTGDAARPVGSICGAPSGAPSATIPATIPSAPPPEPILNLDFTSWAPTYTGQRFNLIHCDFPYGIEAFSGPSMHRGAAKVYEGGKFVTKHREGGYDDSENVYLNLIEALCTNLDRLMSHSGHLMFWLSADLTIMHETRAKFAKLAPDLLFWPKPLVWHKTDNAGVLADPNRGPRHVYEVCMVAVREDRSIVRAVSDAYGAPTDKKLHPSCKPEPVLRHYMQMFCDEHTRLLDPTCGSGSSLRAAESLGAESVLGLELDPEHAKNANVAMRAFRALRSATI